MGAPTYYLTKLSIKVHAACLYSCICPGGGGCLPKGEAARGGVYPWPDTSPWTEWLTDRCKNITVTIEKAKTSLVLKKPSPFACRSGGINSTIIMSRQMTGQMTFNVETVTDVYGLTLSIGCLSRIHRRSLCPYPLCNGDYMLITGQSFGFLWRIIKLKAEIKTYNHQFLLHYYCQWPVYIDPLCPMIFICMNFWDNLVK